MNSFSRKRIRGAVLGLAKWRAHRRRRGTDHTHQFVPGTVPKVRGSETSADGAALLIKFDRPMSMTVNLQDAMIVKIDGTMVKPDHVLQDATKSLLALQYPVDFFKPGQVITWAYEDTHPTEELKGAEVGGVEIDNQTYAVINKTTATPVVKSSEIYANNNKRIVVEWDQEMIGSSDIRFSIFIAIDGGAPILPETVIFNKGGGKFYMMLVMTNPLSFGQNIVWHYDDSTNERLSTKVGNHEATDVPHVVDNQLASEDISYDGTVDTDTDGTRYLVNSVEPITHKAPMHSGEAVTLSGDGKIEVPINATLGAPMRLDPHAKTREAGNTATHTAGVFTFHLETDTTSNINPSANYIDTFVADTVYDIEVKVNVTSGSCYLREIQKGKANGAPGYLRVDKVLDVGVHTFNTRGNLKSSGWIGAMFDGTKNFDADFTVELNVRKITATQGSVTVFDHATKTFTQPTLPLASTYTLKDGTFGTIIKLDTNTFSQADLTAFTARPELVLEWSAGTATIPSAIVKGAKDVVYNAKGMALPVALGAELVMDTEFADASKWNLLNGATLANGKATLDKTEKGVALYQAPTVPYDNAKMYEWELTVEAITTGKVMARIGGSYGEPITTVGIHSGTFSGSDTPVATYLFGDKSDAVVTHYSIKEITSPMIPITGTHTTTNTSQFGVQQIKVGAGAMNGKDDGRYIQLPLTTGGMHLLKVCTTLIAGTVDAVVDTPCAGNPAPPIIIEDEAFDIIVGTAGGDNGFSDDLAFGSLPIDVEIDGHPLTTLYVDHSNRLLFMDFTGMLAPWNAATIKITLGTTGQEVELLWDVGLKMYAVESVAAMNYFTVNDGTALGFIIHSPDTSDDILDLDGDGNPDTVIYDDNGILITEDADSFDIDLDGDGVADISIHK